MPKKSVASSSLCLSLENDCTERGTVSLMKKSLDEIFGAAEVFHCGAYVKCAPKSFRQFIVCLFSTFLLYDTHIYALRYSWKTGNRTRRGGDMRNYTRRIVRFFTDCAKGKKTDMKID